LGVKRVVSEDPTLALDIQFGFLLIVHCNILIIVTNILSRSCLSIPAFGWESYYLVLLVHPKGGQLVELELE
jgi:hypothetical protein